MQALDPKRPEALVGLGRLSRLKQDNDTALACFEQALEIDPSQAINYANIGSNYRELEEPALAVKFYEMALEIDPTIEFARDNIQKLKKLI